MSVRGWRAVRLLNSSGCFTPSSSLTTLRRAWTQTARHLPVPIPILWTRGAKRVASVPLSDLPQGAIPLRIIEDEPIVDEPPAYPTVIQQAWNNMQKFSHCVLLTRVGSFYEMYFDQAEEFAPLLNLKLAKKKTSAGAVSMMGFPFYQLDRYLKILVQDMKKYVAISEEFSNEPSARVKSGGLLFDRRVTRVITPGTLVDEKFMDPWENNFLLSIWKYEGVDDAKAAHASQLGLAWIDLSSGDFFMQTASLDSLSSALARIGPREIIIESSTFQTDSPIASILREGEYLITSYEPSTLDLGLAWSSMLENDGYGVNFGNFSAAETGASNLLLQYVKTNLLEQIPKLRPPLQRNPEEFMMIDKNSIKALEVRSTLKDGGLEGSLLHTVKRTVTNSGHRLLCQRLMSPSTSLDDINDRLDLVAELVEHQQFKETLVRYLRMTFDSWRLLQKFSFGRGDADDLLSLARTIQVTLDIRSLLETHFNDAQNPPSASQEPTPSFGALNKLVERIYVDEPKELADSILDAIDEEKLSEQHRLEDDEAASIADMAEAVLSEEGEQLSGIPKRVKSRRSGQEKEKDIVPSEVWIMQPTASKTLQRLHQHLNDLYQEKDQLAISLRQQSGAQSLTLKWTPGLGHIIHLKGKAAAAAPASLGLGTNTRAIQSSKTTRSLHHPLWTQLGSRIDDAKLRIRAEESRIFSTLRNKVIANLVRLRRNAAVLDELDVAASFASFAQEERLVRPVLDYSTVHHIVAGRHPTVESGLTSQGRTFVPNDCIVGSTSVRTVENGSPSLATSNTPRILLITGPNMGGKSTFLRQNGLISILAQTGSYVPAAFASIGIVDAIFSRVGSADNLYQDQSTFMVEMLETAHILRSATPRSFVIMDEVGRGTTPEDGIAVGYAALHHLYNVNKCRALFATHFHKLADMTSHWDALACHCTDVAEHVDGGKNFSYVHKLRIGVNRQSHALKVATLAGMPESAIQVAGEVLETLKMDT